VASLAVRPQRLTLAIPAGAVWLPFLPNAPYLISDFVHLKQRSVPPLWVAVGASTAGVRMPPMAMPSASRRSPSTVVSIAEFSI